MQKQTHKVYLHSAMMNITRFASKFHVADYIFMLSNH